MFIEYKLKRVLKYLTPMESFDVELIHWIDASEYL